MEARDAVAERRRCWNIFRPRPEAVPDAKAPRDPLMRTFHGEDYEIVFDGTVNR